jgi:hypothetical protein
MTKEQFLADPSRLVGQMHEPAPADWIAEAWSDAQFRENVIHDLVRSVSKGGDFFLAGYWLEVLPTFLSSHEVVALYERIRDESRRLEFEWRPEFERRFTRDADILPPMSEGAF